MIEISNLDSSDILEKCVLLVHASEPFVTLQFSLEHCRQMMQGDYKEVYIATVDGNFAGFVVIQLYGTLKGYIQTICVEPEYRSKGVGTALIRHCEERILKVSPNVFILVSSINPGAQRLYYSLGFEKTGEFKNLILQGHDEYLLRKTIGPIRSFVPAK
ncbi:MAG: family N-acetyltransferase [Bacteroidetes bacterium]|jgi:ribosomal protein S18 acetylase RimI-like enzyme|nr:family N-acetyltransferase [Bacteroidota bacterium]